MNILIVTGNPKSQNHTQVIATTYQEEAEKNGHIVKQIDIYSDEYRTSYTLGLRLPEGDPNIEKVKKSQDAIAWADEIVFVHPIWWAFLPAGLKNWIDSVLTPGFSYKYISGKPHTLLKKKAKVFCTGGSYDPYYTLPIIKLLSPLHLIWKFAILQFNGFDLIDFKVCDRMNINNGQPPEGHFESFLRRVSFSAKHIH